MSTVQALMDTHVLTHAAVSAVCGFILGHFWYCHALFGPTWIKCTKTATRGSKAMSVYHKGCMTAQAASLFVLALIFEVLCVQAGNSPVQYAVAFSIANASLKLTNAFWEISNRDARMRVALIHVAFESCYSLIMAAVHLFV